MRIQETEAKIVDLNHQLDALKQANTLLEEKIAQLDATIEKETLVKETLIKQNDLVLEEKQNEIDSLKLELKQQQHSIQQEKLMQMQELKQDKQELGKLKTENTELKIKLDEKLSEIKLLGDQINDLNANINTLKSADSTLFTELQAKTEQFLAQLGNANNEIAALKIEKEKLTEQRQQFEFVLDEKTREASQLKSDIQKHLQHIAAQGQALEKLQLDLKQSQTNNEENENPSKLETVQQEFMALQAQYTGLYGYIESKNQVNTKYCQFLAI